MKFNVSPHARGLSNACGVAYEMHTPYGLRRAVVIRQPDGSTVERVRTYPDTGEVPEEFSLFVVRFAVDVKNRKAARSLLWDSLVFLLALLLPLPFFRALPWWSCPAEALCRVLLWVGCWGAHNILSPQIGRYHGAEHMALNCGCRGGGVKLTPENVRQESRIDLNCGTSIDFWSIAMMALAVAMIRLPWRWLELLIEFACCIVLPDLIPADKWWTWLRLHWDKNCVTKALAYIAMLPQYCTTRKPKDEHIGVAIRALELLVHPERQNSAHRRKRKK